MSPVLNEVEPIERRESTPDLLSCESRRRPPENREALVQRRASGLKRFRDPLDGVSVRATQWVSDDQAEVDVADERAIPAVGQAAQCVGGQQSLPERAAVGIRCFRQHSLGLHEAPRELGGLAVVVNHSTSLQATVDEPLSGSTIVTRVRLASRERRCERADLRRR